MTIDKDDLLNSILASISRIDYVKSTDIPNIDLYMDQVTSFMDKELKSTKRYEDDKILTKTMINNYAKNDLLPPPVKKKYSKEHLMVLTFIYYFKNLLSIGDIEKLLAPITEKFFHADDSIDIARIYDEVCECDKKRTHILQEDIKSAFETSKDTFLDTEGEDKELLQYFSFICMLSLDVYVKKQIIEKLIDLASAGKESDKKDPEKKEKKEKKDKK